MTSVSESSPARKRQRLSSPFDAFDEDISADSLREIDEVEARFTQSQQARHSQRQPSSQPSSQEGKRKRALAIQEALSQASCSGDWTRPYAHVRSSSGEHAFSSPSKPGPKSRDIAIRSPARKSSSDTLLPEENAAISDAAAEHVTATESTVHFPTFSSASMLAASFLPAHSISVVHDQTGISCEPTSPLPTFSSASAASSIITPAESISALGFASAANISAAALEFTTAGKKNAFVLSTDALKKAAQKLQQWEEEESRLDSDESPLASDLQLELEANLPSGSPATPLRKALGPIENLPVIPDTPSPASGPLESRDVLLAGKKPPLATTFGKARGFKSPLLGPIVPMRAYPGQSNKRPHPFSSTPITASQFTSASGFATPKFVRKPPKANFVTPFKQGMAPGEPGRASLALYQQQRVTQPVVVASGGSQLPVPRTGKCQVDIPNRRKFFGLDTTRTRLSLLKSGLKPGGYANEDLEEMGINALELQQMTPTLALYYSFHSGSSPTDLLIDGTLGPAAALKHLISLGCTLVTKPWVDNHWGLILWKLAGLVRLEPERENEETKKRWCWDEVIRQMLYRYERELNSGNRPPLRLVTTHDTPASSAMVLCISNIVWAEEKMDDENGLVLPSHPELEVTDGWYRLRAKVDESLASAVRAGRLRVGQKIYVSGARLESDKKEPCEILEAYQSTCLTLSGNSSHLAAWHAKLGFTTERSVRSLRSLGSDGGVVSLLDLVVVKAYPVAFLEFKEGESGQKIREGPRSEKEEEEENSRWKDGRARQESVLRRDLEKSLAILEGYADRLSRMAGRFAPTEDDEPPDSVDDLYDELEDATPAEASDVLKRVKTSEAGWLERMVKRKCEEKRERAAEEFESELNALCPPREVRSFRVLLMQDALGTHRPAYRKAQVTVWDVATLDFGEGHKAGTFNPGERYMISNLMPTQMTAWMGYNEEDAEIYLATRRDTIWKKLRSL